MFIVSKFNILGLSIIIPLFTPQNWKLPKADHLWHIALFVFRGFIKKVSSISCVNIYLLSISLSMNLKFVVIPHWINLDSLTL